MHSRALLLTALGVMFCSGCTTEQRLEELGATIRVNEQGEIVEVSLFEYPYDTQITDAELVHLAGLTSLQELGLSDTQITDAGLVHLSGLSGLQRLNLSDTQITDAGVAKLEKVLPNCCISHNVQASRANTVRQTPAAKEPTVDTGSVKARLEELGARIEINEQGQIVEVDLFDTQITDAGLWKLMANRR